MTDLAFSGMGWFSAKVATIFLFVDFGQAEIFSSEQISLFSLKKLRIRPRATNLNLFDLIYSLA